MTRRTWASTSSTSGSSPNSATMSMGSRTCCTILVGSGTLTGSTADSPNRKPKLTGRILAPEQFVQPGSLGHLGTAGQIDLALLPADATRHDQDTGVDRGGCSQVRPSKSMVLRTRGAAGPGDVVVAAENHRPAARAQRLVNVLVVKRP